MSDLAARVTLVRPRISCRSGKMPVRMIHEAPSSELVSQALAAAGLPTCEFTLHRLSGGANNRVYKVERPGNPPLFLKHYFRHPLDSRNRLGAEYDFSRFASARGIARIPRAVAASEEGNFGVYEFVEGEPLAPADVSWERVEEGLAFLVELNRHRGDPEARRLPDASEAAFSIAGHLKTVGHRVDRLREIGGDSAVDREASRFVQTELAREWTRVANHVRQRSSELGLRLAEDLPQSDRILSPSDFGFHNALRVRSGALVFHDFEYAGWDDAAKTVGDFFSQPALPVPIELFERFSAAMASILEPSPDRHLDRMRLLYPVYRVKWATILLGEFLPAGRARREFAGAAAEFEAKKAEQLARSREALERLVDVLGGGP